MVVVFKAGSAVCHIDVLDEHTLCMWCGVGVIQRIGGTGSALSSCVWEISHESDFR